MNHFTVYNDDDQGIESIFLWQYPNFTKWRMEMELHNV
jgi:hypothetical protein